MVTNSIDNLNNLWNNKTCYIIASGPSVLQFDVNQLKNKCVIAVNSGYLAATFSQFFVSDDWAVSKWSYFFDDLVNSETIPLLYEDKLSDQAKLFKKCFLFKHRKGHHLTKPYIDDKYENRICEARSSVGTAIHIAYIMGCNRIILLGLDGIRSNGCRYFWQIPEYEHEKPHRSDNIKLDPFIKIRYNNQQSDLDLLNISIYWESVAKHIKDKIAVYNASYISTIQAFPSIDFNDTLENI